MKPQDSRSVSGKHGVDNADVPALSGKRKFVARANRNKAKAGRSWVYFAQAGEGGPIKIGQTRDVHTRIRALRAMHYEEIRLIGMIPETFINEHTLHGHFGAHCIRGEWFKPVSELVAIAAAGLAIYRDGYVALIPEEHGEHLVTLMPLSLGMRAGISLTCANDEEEPA